MSIIITNPTKADIDKLHEELNELKKEAKKLQTEQLDLHKRMIEIQCAKDENGLYIMNEDYKVK